MKTLKKLLALTMSLCVLFALGACSQDAAGDGESDTLILGTSADYPPYEFHMLDENGNDQIVGFDISLAYQIAEDMGKELVIKDMAFEFVEQELQNGTVDIVLACIAPTPERLEMEDFSEIYREDPAPIMVIREEHADTYTSIESMAGKIVGVQSATTKKDLIVENMPDSELLELAGVPDLINNLLSEKCDGVFLDGGVALGYIENTDGLVAAEGIEIGEGDRMAVAVQKGDPKRLLDSINQAIAECKENGKLDEWYAEAQELSAQASE